MINNKRMLKIFAACIAVVMVIGLVPAFDFNADATVYGGFTDLRDLKASFKSSASADAPVIKNIKLEAESVARFDKVEINFDVLSTWENPFNTDEIQVDGIITYPSGKKVTVPAFYYTPMVPTQVYENKILMTTGPSNYDYHPDYNRKSVWCLRFSGDEVGEYSFQIVAKNGKGVETVSETGKFSCYEDNLKGYAVVSKDNPKYLINSADGTPYFGCGSNIAWIRDHATTNPLHLSYNYFTGRAKLNTNITRVWICQGNQIEWMPKNADSYAAGYLGLGYYNQVMCANFDNVLEMCEDAGLRVMLCTDDNNELDLTGSADYWGWSYNPYASINGGPASHPDEIWTNPEVRKYYKQRMRYIVARWGYSSALFSINMWNDLWKPTHDGTVDFLDDMHKYVEELTKDWRTLLFGSNFNYEANEVLDYTAQYINLADDTKPYVTQECFYANNDFRNTVRNTMWSELVGGAAATMVWSHDTVDEQDGGKGCWDMFSYLLDFTSDLPLDKVGKYTYGELGIANATATNPSDKYQTITTIDSYGDVFGWGEKPTENNFDIDVTLPGMNLQGYITNLYGHGTGTAAWRNPPTFNVDMPNGGQIIVGINEKGYSQNILQVYVDGVLVKETIYGEPGSERVLISEDDPNRYTYVDIPAGKHSITLDNRGDDWMSNDEVYFVSNSDSVASMLTAKSMIADSAAAVYIQNHTYSKLATKILNIATTDFTDVKFTVSGLKEDGKYAMYQFDPDTGKYGTISEVTVSGGSVDISIPAVAKDYAVKLIKLADGEKVKAEGSRYNYLRLSASSDIPADLPSNEGGNNGSENNGGGNSLMIILIAAGALLLIGAAVVILLVVKNKKSPKAE